jgi:outer membrane lipase/esterase
MPRRLLAIACLSVILAGPWGDGASAQRSLAGDFTDLWAFGDSLTDTGNLSAMTSGLAPPSPPYFNGRFSNGPLWIEGLAASLGMEIDFDMPVTVEPLANNQAIAGAFTDTRGVAFPGIGVLSQVDNFLAAGGTIGSDDLVVIWAGGNNYFRGDLDPAGPVTDLTMAVSDLALDAGARWFVVPNLPDLGDTPVAVAGGLTEALNALIAAHNEALAEAMAALSDELAVEIVVVNMNAVFAEIFSRPHIYGFDNVTEPCLIRIPGGTLPTGACPPEGETYDATGAVFWDQLHPSAAVHALFAQFAHASLVAALNLPDAIAERQKIVTLVALGQLRAFGNRHGGLEEAVGAE